MDAGSNKVYLLLKGIPLLAYTLAVFEQHEEISEVVLVVREDEQQACLEQVIRPFGLGKVRRLVTGGATRHASEYNALNTLRTDIRAGHIEVIAIHDGARPFVRPGDVTRVVSAAYTHQAAILAVPIDPTAAIAIRTENTLTALLPTENVWLAQTPQAFLAPLLLAAYDQAQDSGFQGTDTSATIERYGVSTQVVEGSGANIKITTPIDLPLAQYILEHPELLR